jgi:glycosyltransferase involved in cell wall biosynthesis
MTVLDVTADLSTGNSLVLIWAAAIHLLAIAAFHLQLELGMRRIRYMNELPAVTDPLPPLSIVVAARNEERDIEEALRSLLALDYAPLEVIVVNDRSTDATGSILEKISLDHPGLQVLHLEVLPEKWLGKNHALQQGAMIASGEYILFTDADVVFQPDSLQRAVAHADREQLGMLAALPSISMPSLLLESFIGMFAAAFVSYFKPWKAPDPDSKAYVGVGAFNLVSAEAYREAGMHEPIRMRPDDDVQLGKLMKKAGHRLEMINAAGAISVEWYSSVGELVRGLEKNIVAGVEYRLSILAGVLLGLVGFFLWPFVAVVVVPGVAGWIYLAVILLMIGLNMIWARKVGVRALSAIYLPLTVLLCIYILIRNTFLTYWRGGIQWRDTHYSLKELRANKI